MHDRVVNLLTYHPIANLFPMMDEVAMRKLAKSISENGQRDPIIMFEGAILDGRNRYVACQTAGVEPQFAEFSGGDPIAFVVDHNLHRRHLSTSQRAMVAANMAKLKFGTNRFTNQRVNIGPSNDGSIIPLSHREAGRLLQVSEPTVQRANAVKKYASQGVIADITGGKLSVNKAYDDIWKTRPSKSKKHNGDPLSMRGGNVERIHKSRVTAEIWSHLSAALTGLTNLPAADDVIGIVRKNPKRVDVVTAKLKGAYRWLRDFENAWQGEI